MNRKLHHVLFFVIFFICNITSFVFASNGFKSQSVLKDGKWYKIKVSKDGLYALSFKEIKELGIEKPANFSIYGQNGGMLDLVYSGEQPDDLESIPVKFETGGDGVFNNDDLVYFYLKGPDRVLFDSDAEILVHKKNKTSYYAYYFITDSKPVNKIKEVDNSTLSITGEFQYYDRFIYHELDTVNVIQSGREWFGERLSASENEITFEYNFPNLITENPIFVDLNMLSRSDNKSGFSYFINNKLIGEESISGTDFSDYLAWFGYTKTFQKSLQVNSDKVSLKVVYETTENGAQGFVDYLRITAKCRIIKSNELLLIRNIASVDSGAVSQFKIENYKSGFTVWDVTDIRKAFKVKVRSDGTFKSPTNDLREFAVFESNNYLKPVLEGDDVGEIENQNLHGLPVVDYIIISHKKFLKHANELAQFHREESGLSVVVVDQDKIFNEFSSGARDVAALRNFIKMLYDKSLTKNPRYVLLFGDGTYANKYIIPNNQNYILTFQSSESLSPTTSFVTDDYFGILENNEDIMDGDIDVGIGRFPVSDTLQSRTLLNKIKLYYSEESKGDWKNNICFIGDDEDGNSHMEQSDILAENLNEKHAWLNKNKLFLDAYKQKSTSLGARYPDVNKEIYNQMKRGALIMNYTGHGAEFGLAHERILSNDDIKDWSNWGRFPVFMTATCEFSRFDYVKDVGNGKYQSEHSTGEYVVTYENGGGIASFTTTRVVYGNPNFRLSKSFYGHVFDQNEDYNERNRLGDIVKKTKNNFQGSHESTIRNQRKFALLGDPALIIKYPENKVVIDSVNGISRFDMYDTIVVYDTLIQEGDGMTISDTLVTIDTMYVSDTLGALDFVTISGHVEDNDSNVLKSFNGIVSSTVFDKKELVSTLDNDKNDIIMQFELQKNILFKGLASVKNGYFSFSFRLPKDISYLAGSGRISCYAYNEYTEATGSDTIITIGGFSTSAEIDDNEGPDIELFLGNTYFRENGLTNESPVLIANLYDESGINTSTSGIGHEMIAVIDDNFSNPVIMNDFYSSGVDNFKEGTIKFPLVNLSEGEHVVKIRVWDVINNSSEKEIKFHVGSSDILQLKSVSNFPNPVTTSTQFAIEHNLAGEEIDVEVQIFSLNGQLITKLKNYGRFEGYLTPVIEWDGRSQTGGLVESGIYFYKIIVSSSKGSAQKSSKMLIIR